MAEEALTRFSTNEEFSNQIIDGILAYLKRKIRKESGGGDPKRPLEELEPEEEQRLRLEFESFTNAWNIQLEKVLETWRKRPALMGRHGNFVAAIRGRGEAKGQLAGSVPGLDWVSVQADSPSVPDPLRAELSQIQDCRPLLQYAKLPFCRDVDLWHLYFSGGETGSPDEDAFAFYVHSASLDEALRLLDWTNAKIYGLNDERNFRLSARLDLYVRCFMHLVRSRQGRFVLLETGEDVSLRVPWEEEAAPGSDKRTEWEREICRYVAPLERKALDADGKNRFRATMLFKNALFRSDIAVDPNGILSLENESLKRDNLPVEFELDDAMTQPGTGE